MTSTLTHPQPRLSALRPEVLFPLFSPVTTLPGVGEKTKGALERLAGTRVLDLIFHLPASIIDRRFMPPLANAPNQSIITAVVTIHEHHAPQTYSKFNKKPYRVFCANETGTITLVFFKTPAEYIQKQLPVGEQRVISGKVEWSYNVLQMIHPDTIAPVSELPHLQAVEPVYPLTYALSQKMLGKTIKNALKRLPVLPEWNDPELVKGKQWKSWHGSLVALHNPTSQQDILPQNPLRERLAYDELFANQLALQLTRKRIEKMPGNHIAGDGSLRDTLLHNLGFTLTDAQQQVLKEIYADQASPHRMMRLLQGDVGSGKTVVALLAMLNAIECGMQAALMAPTEILARQHAIWINKVGIPAALLTGKTKASERKELLASLASGKTSLVIGTHALFQDDVAFHNLGLVVIDEQHRFGVDQRMSLMKKGTNADMLLMSATPIPRTLTMVLYGDMDVSRLTAKPEGRKPVDTRVMPLDKIHDIMLAVDRAIAQGKKLYWICPLVAESEESDLAAAEARFREFKKRFGDKVGLIHGKMKAEARDPVMMAFKEGQIQLLIATTVVEVGVDVPDATIMMIEHAERFGLSQLHQLRGRVGRSDLPSSCLLLYAPQTTGQIGKARLKIMRDTEDGFVIAEEDLRLRGAGDVLGTKQSGLPDFTLVDFDAHSELLRLACDDAKLLLHNDPELTTPRGKAVRNLLYLFGYDAHIHYARTG